MAGASTVRPPSSSTLHQPHRIYHHAAECGAEVEGGGGWSVEFGEVIGVLHYRLRYLVRGSSSSRMRAVSPAVLVLLLLSLTQPSSSLLLLGSRYHGHLYRSMEEAAASVRTRTVSPPPRPCSTTRLLLMVLSRHQEIAAFRWHYPLRPRNMKQDHATKLMLRAAASSILMSERESNNNNSSNSALASLTTELTTLRKMVAQANELHDKNLATLSQSSITVATLSSRLHDLEQESTIDPNFWDVSNSRRNELVTRDISRYTKLKSEMELWAKLREDAVGALELLEEEMHTILMSNNNILANSDAEDAANSLIDSNTNSDSSMEMISLTMEECKTCASQLLELSQRYELATLLGGPYDATPSCRLVLTAGAGGTEACDWVSMLTRMYTRHASLHMDMKVTTLEESPGEVVGYKSVELLIEGTNAYGWFKGEKGAHRLVRLSPFNANNKRQTTFAGVDVIPVLGEEDVKDIDIPEKELEVTTMRSGGKGGQNVNKVETGVRIKHLPSGIAVKCTQERSQSMNKQLALSRLKAQLLAIAQEQQLQSINAIRGDIVEASWGAQIRNYVMQPYKMVKDTRSGFETSDVDGVLDGGAALEQFVGAWLRWLRAKEEQEKEERENHLA